MTKYNNNSIGKKIKDAALKKIKERLEKIYCSEHNQPPQIVLTQDRLNIMKTCCETFLQEIRHYFKKNE